VKSWENQKSLIVEQFVYKTDDRVPLVRKSW